MSEKTNGTNSELENGPSPEAMAKVMSILQSKLIEATLSSNRSHNAILGVQFQVINDSFPCNRRHVTKQVTVVACGTPCAVVPLNGESSLELRFPESGLAPATTTICATPVDTSTSRLVLAEAIVSGPGSFHWVFWPAVVDSSYRPGHTRIFVNIEISRAVSLVEALTAMAVCATPVDVSASSSSMALAEAIVFD
jgi:hypothetical protein